jgi:hypothetical protein
VSLIGCWSDGESFVGGVEGKVGVGEGKRVEICVEEIVGWTGNGVGSSWHLQWRSCLKDIRW